MKEYIKIKSIELPIYRGSLVVVLSNCKEKVMEQYDGLELTELYGTSFMGKHCEEQGFIMALNFHSEYRKITHGVIAHEAVHLAHYIASHRGIVPDFKNDEPIAYLVDFIVDYAYSVISKLGYKVSLIG